MNDYTDSWPYVTAQRIKRWAKGRLTSVLAPLAVLVIIVATLLTCVFVPTFWALSYLWFLLKRETMATIGGLLAILILTMTLVHLSGRTKEIEESATVVAFEMWDEDVFGPWRAAYVIPIENRFESLLDLLVKKKPYDDASYDLVWNALHTYRTVQELNGTTCCFILAFTLGICAAYWIGRKNALSLAGADWMQKNMPDQVFRAELRAAASQADHLGDVIARELNEPGQR